MVVMAVGVVAIVGALALLTAFGTSATAAARDDVDRRAEAAANAGIVRVAAWLDEVRKSDGDLDRALSGTTGCASGDERAVAPAVANTATEDVNGWTFGSIAFQDATVLVRLFDNLDDGARGSTSSGTLCAEGAQLKAGMQNLARDEDGRVWIISIAEIRDSSNRGPPQARRVRRALYDEGALFVAPLAPGWRPQPPPPDPAPDNRTP